MNKFLFIILAVLTTSHALADQPKDWQLGFQNPASEWNERYCKLS